MAGDVTRQRYREPLRLGPGSRIAHYVIEEQILRPSPSVNITPHDSRWPKDNGGFHYSTDGEAIMTFPNRGTSNDLWRELTGAHIITRTDPGSQDQAFVLLGPGGHKLILGSNTRGGSAFTKFIVRNIPG